MIMQSGNRSKIFNTTSQHHINQEQRPDLNKTWLKLMDVVNVISSQKHLVALDRFNQTQLCLSSVITPLGQHPSVQIRLLYRISRCATRVTYAVKVLIIYLQVVFYPLTCHLVAMTLLTQTLINFQKLHRVTLTFLDGSQANPSQT